MPPPPPEAMVVVVAMHSNSRWVIAMVHRVADSTQVRIEAVPPASCACACLRAHFYTIGAVPC